MFKTIVIDGRPLVRAAIKAVLSQNEFELVAEADNGIVGVDLARKHMPDLMILDINLPGMSGLEVMERIYSFDKYIEMLVLASYPEAEYYNHCRMARASTFLSRNCSVNDFGKAINALMGRTQIPKCLGRLPRFNTHYTSETMLIQSLSKRELMTFHLLAQGMTNREISDYLQLSSKTISTYKVRLMAKLNVFSLAHLLEMAKRNNLV